MDEAIGVLVGMLVGIVVLFLIFREVVCWYWKINTTLTVLQSIDEKLGTLLGSSSLRVSASVADGQAVVALTPRSKPEVTCSYCKSAPATTFYNGQPVCKACDKYK